MSMAHTPKTPRQGDAQGPVDDRPAGETVDGQGVEMRLPIDWQALRNRLFAARELQASLDPQSTPEKLRLRLRGSFDGCAASMLTTYQSASRSINLDTSSYSKPAEGNVPPVADVTRKDGGRG